MDCKVSPLAEGVLEGKSFFRVFRGEERALGYDDGKVESQRGTLTASN